MVEVLIPSTLDDFLAPKAQHVASLFCQHVAPELPDGKSWDDHREEVADLMIATVDKLRAGLCGERDRPPGVSPLDLERQFGLLGGDIFHGALTLNQLFSARPMLGHADYRGPLKGLYHCGRAPTPAAASPAPPATTRTDNPRRLPRAVRIDHENAQGATPGPAPRLAKR